MKTTIRVVTIGMVILQPLAPFASAQVVGPGVGVGVIAGGVGGGTLVGNAGDYNIKQEITNNTAAMQDIIKRTGDTQDKDRDFLIGVVDRLNNQLIELITMKRNFSLLAQKSSSTSPIQLQEYLTQAADLKSSCFVMTNGAVW